MKPLLDIKYSCKINSSVFTAAGVKCLFVTLECLPVLHYSADYIFWSFGINELIQILDYSEFTEGGFCHLEARHCAIFFFSIFK